MFSRASLFCAFVCGAVLASAVAASADPTPRLAPADEYFGPARMSVLEITNRINDAERGAPTYPGLATMQAAIEDWAAKYPADPWIAPREFRVWKLFSALHTPDGDAGAAECQDFIQEHFGNAR